MSTTEKGEDIVKAGKVKGKGDKGGELAGKSWGY